MALIATSESKETMLRIILNKETCDGSSPQPNGDRRLKLFVNNFVPSGSTTISDLIECTSPGYSAITLVGSNWTVSTTGGATSASYAEEVFDIDEEVLVYGYFVTNYDGTELLWVERFNGAPFTLPVGGGSIGVELNFSLN